MVEATEAAGARRADKRAAVAFVRERLEQSQATVLTEYRGLSVTQLAGLRARLRQHDAEYRVVKNTLTLRATRELGIEVDEALLAGPTAATFCTGDVVPVAKVLRDFARESPQLVVKGSILDGQLLDAADTLRLAELESREELLARLAGLFGAVLAQPARLANASLAKAARLFAALVAKREEAGESAPEPAAPGSAPGTAPETAPETAPGPAAEETDATDRPEPVDAA